MTRPVARQAIFNSFGLPDEKSFGVYKALKDVYPAFAKKVFEENPLMHRLVLSGYNPMDIMEYPICGKCETLAAPSGYVVRNGKYVEQCTCVNPKCGATTTAPIKLKAWMRMELIKKVSPEWFDTIDSTIDGIAALWIQSYWRRQREEMERYRAESAKKIGVTEKAVQDFQASMSEQKKIEHLGNTENPNLPKDIEEINMEIKDGDENEE